MERDTFNILFYFRKNKLKNDGKAPNLMRITVNGKRWNSALKVGADPKYWSQQKEKVIGGDDRDSNLVNETIESTKFRLHKIKLGLEDEKKPLTIDAVKNKFLDKDKNQRTILALFQKHNEECKMKVGVQITYSTYERYETCYKHTKEFLKKEYKIDDLPSHHFNSVIATNI
jgi:hypothetical protein